MSAFPPTLELGRELRDHLPHSDWRAAVQRIAERHGLGAAGAHPFASGSDVVWPAGDAVVKLTDPAWRWQIEAEARALEHVAGRLPVRTPRPIALGELEGWPYVVLERVPGRALAEVWPELGTDARRDLARDLGQLVRALHDLPLDGLPDDWDGFFGVCLAGLPERLRAPGVPDALVDGVPAWLDAHGLRDELGQRGRPRVFLHTELLDQHVLDERRSGRWVPAAMIDFADHRVGPFEYELPALVEFVFRGERGLLGTFLRAYGLPEDGLDAAYGERLLAWGLAHRYGSLRRMLGCLGGDGGEPVAGLGELAARLYALP